jgi:hypothetical protein
MRHHFPRTRSSMFSFGQLTRSTWQLCRTDFLGSVHTTSSGFTFQDSNFACAPGSGYPRNCAECARSRRQDLNLPCSNLRPPDTFLNSQVHGAQLINRINSNAC